MKFFAVLAVLVAVAAADFSSWTLPQLSDAIQNPNTDPALLPAMEDALNNLMDSLFAEQDPIVPVDASAPVDLTGWTLHDLSLALQDPTTDPALIPYLEAALNEMMDLIVAGVPVEAVGVPVKPLEVSHWTVQELSEAIQDPNTDPALIPYLEHAINEIMDALISGQQLESIAIVAPAGLAPVRPEQVVEPVPMPVPMPIVEPSPEVTAPAAVSSPLVQIIVNVNQQA
ncbi:hypothetical protein PYW07_005936 [Mythimna separata]|uniref:Uncharacterized protein n=1 Tax=Mythimna separata TaxID=271217 RepID=A0AAD8DRS1_MYTSE|nr:hypothetical protein PYW07_005936 [Mythimna separata]